MTDSFQIYQPEIRPSYTDNQPESRRNPEESNFFRQNRDHHPDDFEPRFFRGNEDDRIEVDVHPVENPGILDRIGRSDESLRDPDTSFGPLPIYSIPGSSVRSDRPRIGRKLSQLSETETEVDTIYQVIRSFNYSIFLC